jgi:Na+/H+-dicarboxylate symporter
MVRWIVVLEPLAIACVMAWLFVTQGGQTLYALMKLIATMYAGLAVVVVVLLVRRFGRASGDETIAPLDLAEA